MQYLYQCEDCHTTPIIILKPISEASNIELCTCGKVMNRVYSTPRIKTGDGIKSWLTTLINIK